MARHCCPSCGWTLVLRSTVEVYGGERAGATWIAVCPNPRRLKPCEQRQDETFSGRWAVVGAHEAITDPARAVLRRPPGTPLLVTVGHRGAVVRKLDADADGRIRT